MRNIGKSLLTHVHNFIRLNTLITDNFCIKEMAKKILEFFKKCQVINTFFHTSV